MVLRIVATDDLVGRGPAADDENAGRVGIGEVATVGPVVFGIVVVDDVVVADPLDGSTTIVGACWRPPSAMPAIMATTSTMANADAVFLMADHAKRRLGTVLVHVRGAGGGGV
jgi:hypothetical protein